MQGGTIRELVETVPIRFWLAFATLFFGLILGWLTRILARRVLERIGVPGAIEGTAFERTAREFGTSTVDILAAIAGYFVFGLAVFAAVAVAEIQYVAQFWNAVAGFLPQLFFAVIVLIVGVLLGDKVELVVSERFRGVKIPQIGVLPLMAKYSVFYLAALIALGQVGVATDALIVLLAAYVFAIVFLGGIAFRQLLSAGAVGTYLLLNQPYTIGDEIRVGDVRGIVQEMDLFVTHVETDGEEYVFPNSKVFADGFVRIRS
ncbi:mechanosensitive ion channel domain-containing protein [Haloplanus aerogenes]|uniref:Mechanosensitive ion channel family protein n=1 Tax=Haloplanus aerogenes TaxID=660522 RepID=A0A3M0D929_9EURY|nr:mechanosensitive ion channel domain-containing protein [Haloplanus aerogenes]AZH26339.1 mechanosensitive ion channel family protein [Haloplanus aerogenes]RMB18202.1 putative transporter (transmembrane protein) [Haloplanus aerogenes]